MEHIELEYMNPKFELSFGQKMGLIAVASSFSIFLIVAGVWSGIKGVSNWTENHQIETQDFDMDITWPSAKVVERKKEVISPVADISNERLEGSVTIENRAKETENPDVAQKILEKFGDHGELALSIATAESHLRSDAIGVNNNGTTDIGIFQINYQTHKGKPECKLDKISTVDGNIECAYSIFKAQGNFTAWVAYTNGKYLAFYK